MTTTLTESTAVLGKPTGKRKWRARLIAAGVGSSGVHTEEALKTTGASAWPEKTKIYFNHATEQENWERPEGDLHNLAGVIASTPEYGEDDGIPGLYADIQIGEKYGPFVEEFADVIGLSIRSKFWGDEVNENGLPIVEGYVPSVLNSVDLVTAPGAKGRILSALESFDGDVPGIIEESGTIAHESNTDERKEKGMTPEEIEAVGKAVAEALKPSFDSLKESLAPVEPDPVEQDEVDLTGVTESLIESGIHKEARARVYEALKADPNTDVDAFIESEKAYIKSVKESFVEESADDSKISKTSAIQPGVLTVNGL